MRTPWQSTRRKVKFPDVVSGDWHRRSRGRRAGGGIGLANARSTGVLLRPHYHATTWTSVSGRQAGDGRAANGIKISVSGCRHGRIVSAGESGTCTVNDVPHYLADAPTAASAWDAYLERMAP